jgi:hypothetical protein
MIVSACLAQRIETDPATYSVVERIYRMYADGAGLRYIAQQLTDDVCRHLARMTRRGMVNPDDVAAG